MKNLCIVILMVIFCFQATNILAQAIDPIIYTAYDYHKVAPAQKDDFLKLAKAWKKIVAYKKQMGMEDYWTLATVVVPSGASAEYNYVTRHTFIGNDQLAAYLGQPFLPENWQALLTIDETELVLRADQIRTFVKSEVWETVESATAPDITTSTIAVFNYFKQPEGKTRADHAKMEKDIWKPIHDARIKDGSMNGWILLGLDMPFGSSLPYDMVTIDVYADMKQMLNPWVDTYFKKVHPGKDVNQLMKQTNDATNLVKGDIRIIIDRLDWQ